MSDPMKRLEEVVARAIAKALTGGFPSGPKSIDHAAARAVIPLVLEAAAQVARHAWIEVDYDVVGIADADMAMKLCEHAATAIRAMGRRGEDRG